jgi:hypothetical protein
MLQECERSGRIFKHFMPVREWRQDKARYLIRLAHPYRKSIADFDGFNPGVA